MGEKTYILSKAQALDDMGMGELAGTLWLEAGRREEEIAPLLEALGREREAAVHRISAASCYERAGDFARAANLYCAALAGPLLEHTRQEVEGLLARCLAHLTPKSVKKPASSPRAQKALVAS
jgi:hypothetical protein